MKFPSLTLLLVLTTCFLAALTASGVSRAQDEIYDEPASVELEPATDEQPVERVQANKADSDRNIIYWKPREGGFSQADLARDCYSLENEIAALIPLTYSYKPGFYEDFYHGVAINTGVWPVFIVTGVAEYRENRRMHLTGKRIEALRGLKARKSCFE